MSKDEMTLICYRCDTELVDITPSDLDEISFFECPSCKCHYAKKPKGRLHDRWRMPITLPLYMVIFEKDPVAKAKDEAKAFFESKPCDLKILKEHIKQELENPKQNVSEIHNFVNPDETKLREFLRCFVLELEKFENFA